MQSPSDVNDRRLETLLLHREIEDFNNAYAAALDDGRLERLGRNVHRRCAST